MPSVLFTLDNQLPSFTGNESPQQQIKKLYDYLVQLKQSLQYSLRNLTAENFNAAALDSLTAGAKLELEQTLSLMQAAVGQLSSKVDSISARIGALEGLTGRVASLEESDDLLAQEIADAQLLMDGLQNSVEGLQQCISQEGGILQRLQALEDRLVPVQIGEDGSLILGAEGMTIQLVGQLIINGNVYEGGSEDAG